MSKSRPKPVTIQQDYAPIAAPSPKRGTFDCCFPLFTLKSKKKEGLLDKEYKELSHPGTSTMNDTAPKQAKR